MSIQYRVQVRPPVALNCLTYYQPQWRWSWCSMWFDLNGCDPYGSAERSSEEAWAVINFAREPRIISYEYE